MRYIWNCKSYKRDDNLGWEEIADETWPFAHDGRRAYYGTTELWLDDDFKECEECEATHRETHRVARAAEQWSGGDLRCKGKVKWEQTKYFKLVAFMRDLY